MKVIVTCNNETPFCFEIIGHAPNIRLCAAFSMIKEVMECGIREKYHAPCLLQESDGKFMIQVDKEFACENWRFFLTIYESLKRLCKDNNIDFTEEEDND